MSEAGAGRNRENIFPGNHKMSTVDINILEGHLRKFMEQLN